MLKNKFFTRIIKQYPVDCGLFILRLFSYLPMPIVNVLGTVLGTILYYTMPKRRNVGLVNLNLCFPEMSNRDKHRLIKEHFQELVRASLVYGLVFYASPQKLQRLVVMRGRENLIQFANNTPVVILAPHFLGLDLGANRMTLETPGYSIYARLKNEYLSDKVKAARLRFIKHIGGEVFSRQEGLRTIVRKMQQTYIPFYYLPDQDMDEHHSVYVPFFAHPHCATLATLPKLVKLTGAKVVPMATYREGNHFVVEVLQPWPEQYPTGDIIKDVTIMNQCIETMIMKHPAQYLWLHKRFKTQPDLPRGQLYANDLP